MSSHFVRHRFAYLYFCLCIRIDLPMFSSRKVSTMNRFAYVYFCPCTRMESPLFRFAYVQCMDTMYSTRMDLPMLRFFTKHNGYAYQCVSKFNRVPTLHMTFVKTNYCRVETPQLSSSQPPVFFKHVLNTLPPILGPPNLHILCVMGWSSAPWVVHHVRCSYHMVQKIRTCSSTPQEGYFLHFETHIL